MVLVLVFAILGASVVYAQAGIEVVLMDVTREAAERGRDAALRHVRKLG